MRWVPTIAVIVAPLAWAVAAVGRANGSLTNFIATILPSICVVTICALSFARPRLLYGEKRRPLDERELVQHGKATAVGLSITGITGALICGYMSFAVEYSWWTPSADDWRELLQVLSCWIFGLPLAFIHWAARTPLDDEDDQ